MNHHQEAENLLNAAWDDDSDNIHQEAKSIYTSGFYAALNIAMPLLRKCEEDYRGLATIAANNGMRATAKDALESANYIKAFLEEAK